jgi:LacI family transcriptional regulator
MKKKVSLKDVAHAVGVSTALVSYVLNNKEKEARVGKEIAEVIRNTAKKLDYQPNHIAKSLKSGKSHTIGLIVADISNPFFANIARTIEDEAKKSNYTVIIGSSDENPDKSWDLINVLIKRQVDGFIIVPTENSEKQIQYLNEQNIPFVLIDRYFPGIPANYVVTDNYQASYDAVLHLIKNDRKKIGLIAYKSNLIHMKERKRGYTEALKDNKLLTKTSLIREVSFNNITEDVDKSLTELLDSKLKVDALFFATNTLAMQGLKFLIRKKYRIPEHVAVVCFDESDVFDFFNFPLAFVNQPLERVAKEAVQMLVNQTHDNDNSKSQVSISSTLVVKKPGI